MSPIRRLVTTQGPLQLLTALGVLFEEKSRNPDIRYIDTLLIHGMYVSGDPHLPNKATLDLASVWQWDRIIMLDEFEAKLYAGELGSTDNAARLLPGHIAIAQTDQVFAVRNWQHSNEVILKAYPHAYKITYGDALGQIDSYATANYVQFDEARLFLPFSAFSYSGEKVKAFADLNFKILEKKYLLGVISRYLEISAQAREIYNQLKSDSHNKAVVLMKNGTESKVTQLEKEIEIYLDAVVKYSKGANKLILKPHPRETLRQSYILKKAAWNLYKLPVEIIGENSFTAYLPFEIFCYDCKFHSVVSPLVTGSCRQLAYLYGIECYEPLDPKLLSVLNPDRLRHYSNTDFLNREIVQRLKSWDGKSPVFEWNNQAENLSASAPAGRFWPSFKTAESQEVSGLVSQLQSACAASEMHNANSLVNKLVAYEPNNIELLSNLSHLSEVIGNLESSKRCLELLTIIEPRKPETHLKLSEILGKLNLEKSALIADCCGTILREEKVSSPEILIKSELPKLTIVTPCFNQVKFIEITMDSILSQKWPNLEYIVIDGGSNDGTAEIIKKYSRHLAYWVSEKDAGQYFALNKGFARSTGEIMAWMNADDIYHENAFLVAMDVFRQQPDMEWMTGQRSGINEAGQITWIDPGPMNYYRERFLSGHFDDPWIQQESVFWRRSLWNKAGGHVDTRWKLAADLALWTVFFRHASLTSIGYPLAAFRKRQDQRSQLFFEDYMKEGMSIIAEENAKIASGKVTQIDDAPKSIELQLS